MRGKEGLAWYTTIRTAQGRRTLRSFWGAARISGLSPDSPPLFRRAKTPWSIRIHIEFDPFIHLPFSCCLGAVCVCPARHSPPHLQSFPPCDDLFTASPAPITIIPPARVCVSRPRLLNWFDHAVQQVTVCLSVCSSGRSRLLIPTLCAALWRSNCVGPQSYCRQLPFPAPV